MLFTEPVAIVCIYTITIGIDFDVGMIIAIILMRIIYLITFLNQGSG